MYFLRLGARWASKDRQYKIDTNNLFEIIARDRDIFYYGNVYGANIDKVIINISLKSAIVNLILDIF